MRGTLLPWAIILAKACNNDSQGMYCDLSYLLPNHVLVYAIITQYFPYLDKRGLLQQEYSQPTMPPLSSLSVGSKSTEYRPRQV